MKTVLLRGRARSFEAWLVGVSGCKYADENILYTFSNKKLAYCFIRLCKAGYLPSCNYSWIQQHTYVAMHGYQQ
jgi:hypothetical protein